MKILILCTGNSCRSQMAQGFLQSFAPDAEVVSAGTEPAEKIHPLAVEVMRESGIDISHHVPRHVSLFLDDEWDYVITVCGGAAETCPAFSGKVKKRLHIGFDDPAAIIGSDEFKIKEFRRVRDEIREAFLSFYSENIKPG